MPAPPTTGELTSNTPANDEPEVVNLDDVIVQAAGELDGTKATKKRKGIDPSVEIKKPPGRTCKKLRGGGGTTPLGAAMQRSPAKKSDQNSDAAGLPAGRARLPSSDPGASDQPTQPPGDGWVSVMQKMLGGLEGCFNARMDTTDEGLHSKICLLYTSPSPRD